MVNEPNIFSTSRSKSVKRRSSSQFSTGVSTPTSTARSSVAPSSVPPLTAKVTRGEFKPHIGLLADSLKACVRTAAAYDEWPESHVVKIRQEEWLWKLVLGLVKEDNTFMKAVRDLENDAGTRKRLLQYVSVILGVRSPLMKSVIQALYGKGIVLTSILSHAKEKVQGHYQLGVKGANTAAKVSWLMTGNVFHYGGLDLVVRFPILFWCCN